MSESTLVLWLGRPNHPTISIQYIISIPTGKHALFLQTQRTSLEHVQRNILHTFYKSVLSLDADIALRLFPKTAEWLCDATDLLYIYSPEGVPYQVVLTKPWRDQVISHPGLKTLSEKQITLSPTFSSALYLALRNGSQYGDIAHARAILRQRVLTGNWTPEGSLRPLGSPSRQRASVSDVRSGRSAQIEANQVRQTRLSSLSRNPRPQSVSGGEYRVRLEPDYYSQSQPGATASTTTITRSTDQVRGVDLAARRLEAAVFPPVEGTQVDLATLAQMYPAVDREQYVTGYDSIHWANIAEMVDPVRPPEPPEERDSSYHSSVPQSER